MHWLRIDRYYSHEETFAKDVTLKEGISGLMESVSTFADMEDPAENPQVVFQPVMCQHCNHAPCETVCPVAATSHGRQGQNHMAYNRCVGTRYCANNCPYKVRRFNWSDYTGASTHGRYGPDSGVGKLNDVVHQMNDELTRMVLNPDVVTRSRGVMEKCTFCIQRTQLAKLDAKKENRPLKDGDVITACQQACSVGAITFGNAHDNNSMVSKIRQQNPQRGFYVIEQLHTLPNITYLAKVRNTDEIIEDLHAGGDTTHKVEVTNPDSTGHVPARTGTAEEH